MKIVVIGGTGLIGTKVVSRLRARGHEVLAASPKEGVDTLTGKGLVEALRGAEVVIDVTNSPSFADADVLAFFETSTRNQLAAEREAGVKHHVALTIVGTDRVPDSGYFRAKVAQEARIAAGPTPYTLVHATQFHEFVDAVLGSLTEGDVIRAPTAYIQTVASDDVADAVVDAALAAPTNGRVQVAGPEALRFDELARRVNAVRGTKREVVTDPTATYFGARLEERSLIPDQGAARLGKIRLEDWLRAANK
ncbi:MAG: SDR family oxidoreductase [Polyangiales bacterium]